MTSIDTVYMLVHEREGLWHSPPATNLKDAWAFARQWEQWNHNGQLNTREWENNMRREGWRAKKVTVSRAE